MGGTNWKLAWTGFLGGRWRNVIHYVGTDLATGRIAIRYTDRPTKTLLKMYYQNLLLYFTMSTKIDKSLTICTTFLSLKPCQNSLNLTA